ncbi:MAG: PrsW family intramembrane metalloprotease [Candidatus Heimdallarchaeota archaeon]|nr:PrsW family intramembrane metalloprotease [Candidatus Heimdallarchaeota archaeon]
MIEIEFLARLIAITLVFSIIFLVFFLKKQQYEAEPIFMIILAFILGAGSTIPSYFTLRFLSQPLDSSLEQMTLADPRFVLYAFILPAVVFAPFVEELYKGLIIYAISRTRFFDGPLDGLIFGGIVGIGFSAAEDVMYGIYQADPVAGIYVTTIRSLLMLAGHPLYSGMLGMAIGMKKIQPTLTHYPKLHAQGVTRPIANFFDRVEPSKYLRSVGLHALWNFGTVLGLLNFALIILYSVYLINNIKEARKIDQNLFMRGYYHNKHDYGPESEHYVINPGKFT